mmetsp:Transcript_108961/g.232834  ORF Transcript_108961/g.232834 Transcript_108961/m.232834 type:complete len:235 (+) Transcript_108961:64-768(+)
MHSRLKHRGPDQLWLGSQAWVDAEHGRIALLSNQWHLAHPTMPVLDIPLLHSAHSLVEGLQRFRLLELPGAFAPCQRADRGDDHSGAHRTHLRKGLHLGLEVYGAPLHRYAEVRGQLLQDLIRIAVKDTPRRVCCEIPAVLCNGNKVRRVELLHVPILACIEVEADWVALLLRHVHALEIRSIVPCSLDVPATARRCSVVVLIDEGVQGLDLANAVIAAHRIGKHREGVFRGGS